MNNHFCAKIEKRQASMVVSKRHDLMNVLFLYHDFEEDDQRGCRKYWAKAGCVCPRLYPDFFPVDGSSRDREERIKG